MSGNAVTELQTALQIDGESVQITGTFDDQTASAVTAFQEKYASQILAPEGLTYGTGYAGKATRAELNALFGCTVSTGLAPMETALAGSTSTFLISYSWQGSSTETYVDPNNTFSIQYLQSFSIVPSDEYNGLGYQSQACPKWVNCSNSNQLSELLIGIQPPGSEFPDPSVNTYLSYITIAYGTSTTEMACEQPGDSSTTVMHYEEAGIHWDWGRYRGISIAPPGFQGLSDQFQTYYAGACWGVEFDWASSNDTPILPFEEAVMSTFQFLNKNAQPYYVPYGQEDNGT